MYYVETRFRPYVNLFGCWTWQVNQVSFFVGFFFYTEIPISLNENTNEISFGTRKNIFFVFVFYKCFQIKQVITFFGTVAWSMKYKTNRPLQQWNTAEKVRYKNNLASSPKIEQWAGDVIHLRLALAAKHINEGYC